MFRLLKENAIALLLVVVCVALAGRTVNLQKQINTNARELGIHESNYSQAMTHIGERLVENEEITTLVFEILNEKSDRLVGEASVSANKAIRVPRPEPKTTRPNFDEGRLISQPQFSRAYLNLRRY